MTSEELSESVPQNPGTTPTPTTGRGKPFKIIGIVLAAVLVLLAGTYGVGYALAGDRVPRNASVEGVAIGGMSQSEAEAALERELGPRANKPLTLKVDDKSYEVAPAELGLGVDIPATVAQSGVGRNADPRHIWKVLAGGGDLSPVVTLDETVLTAYVAKLAEQTSRPATNASIAFKGTKVDATAAKPARALGDLDAVAKLIKESYLVRDEVVVPVTFADPEVSDAEAAEAKAFAEAIVSGPITLELKGGGEYKVPVETLIKSYSFVVENGKIVAKLDAKKLYELNAKGLDKLPTAKPKNARVEIRDGKPYVVPSVDGTEVNADLLVKAVTDTVAKKGKDRVAEVTPNGARAKYTTEQAQKSGVKEIVSEFSTPFPYAEYRNVNLSVAANLMNNTFLKPGDQFSMNEQIGPRSPSQGFIDGYFIEGGILKKGLAGGISQSATTVFNAAFFAGVKLDQWQPHTLYFSRYPAGRESTVYYPSIDVKFTNDTPYGMVVQAFVKKAAPGGTGSITVRIWSTKHFTVQSSEPTKSGFYSGTTRWIQDPKCEYQGPIQGFTAKYSRTVRTLDGSVAKQQNFSWKYSAGDEIRCGKKPSTEE